MSRFHVSICIFIVSSPIFCVNSLSSFRHNAQFYCRFSVHHYVFIAKSRFPHGANNSLNFHWFLTIDILFALFYDLVNATMRQNQSFTFGTRGNQIMYSGKELWKGIIPFQLEKVKVSEHREIETYPDLPVNLYTALVRTAAKYPDKPAVYDDCGHTATFRELLEKTDRFASYLKSEAGVKRGDRIAVMLYNSLEFGVVFLAVNKLGAVAIPFQTKYREVEIHSLLAKAFPSYVITDPHFAEWFAPCRDQGAGILVIGDIHAGYGLEGMESDPALVPETEGELTDDALMVFTSGTTSQSKGVVIKNFNIMHAVVSYEITLRMKDTDVAVIPVPMYLITGLIAIFGLFIRCGGTVYIQQFFDADEVLTCVRDHNVTFVHASPTVFSLLLAKAPFYPELPSLTKFACGSSNMPKEKIRQLHAWLPQSAFHTVYGLTETTSPGTIFPVDAATSPYIGSSGIPIPGMNYRIVREDGSDADPYEVGTVMLNGANLLDSYYQLDTPLLKDNWLDSGDLGYANEEGYIFIVDRKKDMINRGGEKITSFDVENEIYQIKGIVDAAVVGIPDEKYGEVPVAVVKAEPGFSMTEQEIRAYLKTRLASYQVPAAIRFVDEIPVTPNGKVNKKYIRTIF